MNKFERALLSTLGRDNLSKIQSCKIGLAGAGGLGSNCARFLVCSGFKRFKIVDFDRVEYSNLNRQFYFLHQVGQLKVDALDQNLSQINPELEIEKLPLQIDQTNVNQLFDDCHILIEALDRPEDKSMVVEAYWSSAGLIVAASGLAGWGRGDDIITRRIKPNFFMVGDMVSEATRDLPPLAPGVNIVAAKQADVVLSCVLGVDIHDD